MNIPYKYTLHNTNKRYYEWVELPDSDKYLFSAPFIWVEAFVGGKHKLRYWICEATLDIRILLSSITHNILKDLTMDQFKRWGLITQQLTM